MSRARRLTEPTKRKCSQCGGDLPPTDSAPPVKSEYDNSHVCADCKTNQLIEIYFNGNSR